MISAQQHSFLRASILFLCLVLFPAGAHPAEGRAGESGPAEEPTLALEKVIHDYIALYARETLEEWKKLFHPALSVAHAAPDGGIRVRNLDEFFAAQKSYFETGRAISERLENVHIAPGRRTARVTADFIFVDAGEERRGTLGLHLAEGQDGWKIVAILFSYNQPR